MAKRKQIVHFHSILKWRDLLKDLLQAEISAKPTPKLAPDMDLSSDEIQARKSLLARERELAALHKDLVLGGILSEVEFWESRKYLLESEMFKNSQKKGISSSSLSSFQTTAQGSDLTLKLDSAQIRQIFLEYPSVKRAYEDNVPHKMESQKFWSNFVVSKYFHRSRGTLSSSSSLEVGNEFFKKYELDDGICFIIFRDKWPSV